MASTFKIAIAGTGGMAVRIADLICAMPEMTVAGVLSHDPERAARLAARAGGAQVFGSVAEMAAAPDIGLVYVAGGNASHAGIAAEALAAGRRAWVEKPLTPTAEATDALIEAAQASKSLLVENLWTLALPAYSEARAAIADGRYGALRGLRFDFAYPATVESHPGLFDPETGGVLRDRAVYGLASALTLAGPVAEQEAMVRRDTGGVDVAAVLSLRHASGALSQISVAMDAAGTNTFDLTFERGVMRLGPPSLAAETVTGAGVAVPGATADPLDATSGLGARLRRMPGARKLAARRGAKSAFASYGADPYAPMLAHVADCARQGASESDLVPHALSARIAQLIDAALAR